MKLYATTTSERASKGQGGNEYLNIDITTPSEKHAQRIVELRITTKGKETHLYVSTLTLGEDNQCIDTIIPLPKGKKQKGVQ